MKPTPTDIAILDRIYERYYETFSSFMREEATRQSKTFVPIDIGEIAADLDVDEGIVFGRLYYDLERRYGYTQDDGTRVRFFALTLGKERHCINFPYAASVLAALRDERRKYVISTGMAVIALIVSLVSICLSVLLR